VSVNLVIRYPDTQALVWTSVTFTYLYVAAFSFGLGTIPALLVAEVFRQAPRSAAYSVSQAVQWCINLLVSATYPNLQKAAGGYVFLVYFVVVVACLIFFFMYMPETKNRTFDEVAHDLAFGRMRRQRQSDAVLQNESDSAATSVANSKAQLIGKYTVDDSAINLLAQEKDVELHNVNVNV